MNCLNFKIVLRILSVPICHAFFNFNLPARIIKIKIKKYFNIFQQEKGKMIQDGGTFCRDAEKITG